MHAGTCAQQSASFAAMPGLMADATVRAAASGPILFRGREEVALSTMTDGDHVIVIDVPGRILACGKIPKVAEDAPVPGRLPLTGGPTLLPPAAVLAALALGVGLFLRRSARRA